MRRFLLFLFLTILKTTAFHGLSPTALVANELSVSKNPIYKWAANDPVSNALGDCGMNSPLLYNPALCADQSQSCYIAYRNHFLSPELSEWTVNGALASRWFHYGGRVCWMGFREYNKLQLSVFIGKRLNQHLSVGCDVNWHSLYYEGSEGRMGFLTLSMATIFYPCEKSTLALSIHNPTQNGFKNHQGTKQVAPLSIIIEHRLRITNSTQWLFNTEWNGGKNIAVHTGVAYTIEMFEIRCGAFGRPLTPTCGMGFSLRKFRIDLQSEWHNRLGCSLNCGIGYNISL